MIELIATYRIFHQVGRVGGSPHSEKEETQMKGARIVLWENATDYMMKSYGVAPEVALSLGWGVGRGGGIWL